MIDQDVPDSNEPDENNPEEERPITGPSVKTWPVTPGGKPGTNKAD